MNGVFLDSVGMVAALVADQFCAPGVLGANLDWVRFIASIGSVLLTFLAGAELDPDVMRTKLREVTVVGMIGFLAPFLGCAALARFVLGWDVSASWLGGIALSTTSMAVVYAVMIETGFNKTEFGKGILGACFLNDLGTVIASAIVPTMIANAAFLPRHLLAETPGVDAAIPQTQGTVAHMPPAMLDT